MILRLRDQGCSVFFSSHVLSDAETLCSRVGIVAGGRLVATGALADILAFEVHGWELVASGVSNDALERVKSLGRAVRVTPLGPARYALELPLSATPDRILADLAADGARLVSLTPLRETLEDFFVRQIGAAPKDRAVEPS